MVVMVVVVVVLLLMMNLVISYFSLWLEMAMWQFIEECSG